ncbi:prolyl-tRNA synthetase [Geosmithia morbida]|uniref:proline--tRNA ligase n=1 Tax=Geosmithia morbida TaxID=1094350 RepID=A0A9P4YV04_9HYPO|nr:prolyl-tRNA synthetase [Geosmithia morbida]KAF4123315.1 prolyl-tRNA synthetase [Geosmithia morbida]
MAPTQKESGHEKLVRAGFLRQAHSGIFQLLPLGARVQDKIERLVDKHMQSLGASRLSLSTITSESLWRKSGRFESVAPELFRLRDRKDVPLLLAPTHEEEITVMVASTLKSYKDLPLRLYQITRKYRDEIRPRHGLLRSREFLMKDMYSFDTTYESAFQTYQDTVAAYKAIFSELKLPVVVAEASSGDMGGDLSHEYLLAHPIGSDTMATCNSCGYAANDEVAASRPVPLSETSDVSASSVCMWRGITKDRRTLVNAWLYKPRYDITPEDVNIHAIKSVVPDLDTSLTGDVLPMWKDALEGAPKDAPVRLLNVVDSRLSPFVKELADSPEIIPSEFSVGPEHSTITQTNNGSSLNLLRLQDGDGCVRCESGTLRVDRALELGHTFYLGTRYSEPLDALVSLPEAPGKKIPVQMGCYGIGISRIFGTVAEHLADDKGLNWPNAIAPFQAVVIPTSDTTQDTLDFYDRLSQSGTRSDAPLDIVLDDRKQGFGWKMKDADLTGYPVTVVLGRGWKDKGTCEIQCRRLSVRENISLEAAPAYLRGLLEQL